MTFLKLFMTSMTLRLIFFSFNKIDVEIQSMRFKIIKVQTSYNSANFYIFANKIKIFNNRARITHVRVLTWLLKILNMLAKIRLNFYNFKSHTLNLKNIITRKLVLYFIA
jgi:hypothetical protein